MAYSLDFDLVYSRMYVSHKVYFAPYARVNWRNDMLNIFHVSRHWSELDISVGLEGFEVALMFSRKPESRRVVKLTHKEQFLTLIESLEHALGPFVGWHKGFNAFKLNEQMMPLWSLTGTFRQDSVMSGLDEWIQATMIVTYFPAFEGMYSLEEYSFTMRRGEAQRLQAILKDYSQSG